jgi:hypothetical protein
MILIRQINNNINLFYIRNLINKKKDKLSFKIKITTNTNTHLFHRPTGPGIPFRSAYRCTS